MPRLENWSFGTTSYTEYSAPEDRRNCLRGLVYGHPNFDDGEEITTSEVFMLDTKQRVANTRNTFYKLGEPSLDWLDWLTVEGFDIHEFDFDRGT